MAAKKPKYDQVLDGVRVRIYSTRSGYEAIFNDDDYEDPNSYVLVYPRLGDADSWATQARLEYSPDD